MESRWYRKAVSRASPVRTERRRPSSLKNEMHLECIGPSVSKSQWNKCVRGCQRLVFEFFSTGRALSCASCDGRRCREIWLGQRVSDGHVPRHAAAGLPWNLRQSVGSFTVWPQQSCRLLDRWNVSLRQCPPHQVVDDVMSSCPTGAASARESMRAQRVDFGAARTLMRLA